MISNGMNVEAYHMTEFSVRIVKWVFIHFTPFLVLLVVAFLQFLTTCKVLAPFKRKVLAPFKQ